MTELPKIESSREDRRGTALDRFSHRIYLAAFGSYEGNHKTEEPENELLVGRENQRARLLNLFLNTAQRGAYLITGHRGSGKTTFVNYCLNEYRFEIFHRYLKSNLGRAFLWDRFGLVGFGVLVFLLCTFVHQALAYLLLPGTPSHPIEWLAVACLTLFALYPFVSAYDRLCLIVNRLGEIADSRCKPQPGAQARESKADSIEGRKAFYLALKQGIAPIILRLVGKGRPNARPILLMGATILFLWAALPSVSPAEAIARMVFLVGWLFFFVTLGHETLPRPQEIHVTFLIGLAGLDLWWTSNFLEPSFRHTTVGFLISGLLSGAFGLIWTASHKHSAVQKWLRVSKDRLPPDFLRKNPLDWILLSKKHENQPPLQRGSLTVLFLIIFGTCCLYGYGSHPDAPTWLFIFFITIQLPIIIDLVVLSIPQLRTHDPETLRESELSATALAVVSAGRWYVFTALLILGALSWVFLKFPDFRGVGLFAIAKVSLLIVGFYTIYGVGRILRFLGFGFDFLEPKSEPDELSGGWRPNTRFRTRADHKNAPDELLQAAISGQHAQPLLLIFAKAVVLIQLGLLLVYPTAAWVQESVTELVTSSQMVQTSQKAQPQPGQLSQWLCSPLEALAASAMAIEDPVNDGAHYDPAAWTLRAQATKGHRDLFSQIGAFPPDSSAGFHGDRNNGLLWAISLLLVTLSIAYLEYEWILRGGQHVRPDSTLRHQTSEVRSATSPDDPEGSRWYQRRLLQQTLFWRIHQAWLPILTIPVNLGFDALDHRRVVEAMLTGLRDVYEQVFFRWTSPTRFVIRGSTALLVVWITMSLGAGWFYLNDELRKRLENGRLCASDSSETTLPPLLPSIPLGLSEAPGMQLVCLAGELPARIIQWPLWQRSSADDDRLEQAHVVKSRYEGSVLGFVFPELQRAGYLTFRVYHLGLLLLLWSLFSWVGKRHPIFPYRKILNEIEMLLAQISSRQREELRYHPALIPRLVGVFTGEDKVKHWETEPFDPRTIEISVLRILRDIQDPTVYFPYLARHRVNLPTPEIIFKFDELDKLGIGVLPQHDTVGPEMGDSEQLDLERQRSRALHNLFADMKNLVSSGAARFIFIGGRNLHDEWLADQTARRPLLTNIFETEIYLPSLLLGEGPVDSNAQNLTDGIVAFVEAQYQHALQRNQRAILHRYRPWLTPWLESPSDPIFVQSTQHLHQSKSPTFIVRGVPILEEKLETDEAGLLVQNKNSSQASQLRSSDEPTKESLISRCRSYPSHLRTRLKEFADSRLKPSKTESDPLRKRWGNRALPYWKDALTSDFIEFLAYRSRGNVKRLKAILERYVEPSLKVLGHDLPVDSQHVLVFRDVDRFRIQLIAEVYRRILSAFDPRIRFYDDKLVVGMLYIADYLLKFHRRAFAWNSLQKVDELVNVHRAPELPGAVDELLHAWQQKYLHPIRNGMYDYRFNSDFSMELQFLSRRSDEELAALNFTLDEAQALKAIYRNRIAHLKDPAAFEFTAVLGELHELDGEHDMARYYYNRSLAYIDEHFHQQVSRKKEEPAFYSVLIQSPEGLKKAQRRIAWGMSRLRLKMQIGMSHEQSNDFEQAQAHYRNARTLASALLRALLNAQQLGKRVFPPFTPDYGYPDYASTLKHLNLIFQPVFAEAWVSEKQPGGVDTSTRLIERSVWELRWQLPLVREEFDPNNLLRLCRDWVPEHDVLHLNFALIMSEQHNKIGDLVFFKGGVSFSRSSTEEPDRGRARRKEGFLRRARYHYAVALYEIRFFNRSRRLRWPENHGGAYDPAPDLVAADGWGDFVYRSAAGSLSDFGESFLANTSAVDILTQVEIDESRQGNCNAHTLDQRLKSKSDILKTVAELFHTWLGGIDPPESGSKKDLFDDLLSTLFGNINISSSEPAPKVKVPIQIRHLSPIELGLAPWLGFPRNLPDLWSRLPRALDTRAPNDLKEILEKSRMDPERKDLQRCVRPDKIDPFESWFPSRPKELQSLSDGPVQDFIHFQKFEGPLESLGSYIGIIWAAGYVMEKGGCYEDAARNKLRLLETVVELLSWKRLVIHLNTHPGHCDLLEEAGMGSLLIDIEADSNAGSRLVDNLLELGLLVLTDTEALLPPGADRMGYLR